MYLLALQNANAEDKIELNRWYSQKQVSEEKIEKVKKFLKNKGGRIVLEASKKIQ